MKRLFLRNQIGSSLIFVFAALGILASISIYVLKVNKQMSEQTSALWQRTIADETAQSAFVIMESAMARRLWSPPPDNNCMIDEEFSVTGTLDNGATYEVNAKYIIDSKTLEMVATGKYKDYESKYLKNLKIYDVTDYLVLSKAAKTTTIAAPQYSATLPASMIARDRKVYFEGGVAFQSITDRAGSFDWDKNATVPMRNPGEINIILQAERMIFKGGIMYSPLLSPRPAPDNYPNFYNDFKDLTYDAFGPNPGPLYYWQWGGGGSFMTGDYTLANQVNASMRSGTAVSMSLIRKHFYPIAFTTGSLPLNATYASDNGTYFNDPNRWIIAYYSYGPNGVSTYGHRANFSCYTLAQGADTRYCSASNLFPRGFEAWRLSADLKGVLFTDDFEELQTQTITWDNMEAMKDDAKSCGIYVSPTSGKASSSYEDCDMSDYNFVTKYIYGNGTCNRIYRLDSESIQSKLANFSSGAYSGTAPKTLRRVIYSEVPLEIVQNQAAGLATNMSADVRKNLPLWVVNEDVNIIRPHQPDTTSPIDERPLEFRQLYFNGSSSGAMTSLKLVYISPEKTIINSPFHVPLTPGELSLDFPVVGGKIRPNYSSTTDWKHQEEDGFKYGVRIVNIKNTSLIDNTTHFNYNEGFSFRGLWSVVNSSAIQVLRNGCMMSPSESEPISGKRQEPAYIKVTGREPTLPPGHPALGRTVPPLSSRFYDKTAGIKMPLYYRPYVFQLQNNIDVYGSVINFEGTRLGVYFSDDTSSGKRNLNVPKYNRVDMYATNLIDLSKRSYVWDSGDWYNEVGTATSPIPCSVSPVTRGTTDSIHQMHIPLNLSVFTFMHVSPAEEFNSIGSIMSLPLPMIKMRK
ncbi:hypothetical protein [Peredibacter starrii]|uniref:Uncharacterized protein n=1 Tax=Peredibacter starrii TaxID=28202 RepID=A0AAX4HQI2_9BACT|nr:hypothetical protein [Peredibacter starrii]WPU65427.1 hypothetical protein SOO65_01565 [Peredibacter starrii]